MRLLSVVLLTVLCVCRSAVAVQVKVGEQSFPLESVKQLLDLMDLDDNVSPHLSKMNVVTVCTDPLLPQVFQTVCQEKEAGIIMSALVSTIRSTDPCEICANPACYGC